MSQIWPCVRWEAGHSYPLQAFAHLPEMERGALQCVTDRFINKEREVQVFPFLHSISGLWVSWACLAMFFTVNKGIFSSALITKR